MSNLFPCLETAKTLPAAIVIVIVLSRMDLRLHGRFSFNARSGR